MKILKILTFIISFFIFQNFTFSWFESSSSIIDSEKEFSKIHWEKNVLYVHEDYVINPFSWSNIVRNQTNRVTTSYSVDWRIFNSTHPKYQSNSNIYENWKQEEPWIYTMIRLLENTYTRDSSNILMPNQQVTVRKYYKVDFNFDKTPPTWGDLELFNDENATQRFTYTKWEWLNQPKYYTMTCTDLETWCRCDFNLTKTTENWWIDENNHACTNSTEIIKKSWKVQTIPSIIWHLAKPKSNFENNVNVSWDVEWTISGWSLIMYDQSSPRIGLAIIDNDNKTVEDFNYWYENNREYIARSSDGKLYDWEQISWKVYYNIKNNVSIKANQEYKLWAVFLDQYITDSSNWVSWVKNYSIKVSKKNNSDWTYSEIYNFSRDYWVYNSNGTKTISDQKWKIFDGLWTLKESWEYKIRLEVFDWAWNHTIANSNFNIYPESVSESNVTISSSWWEKYANNSDYYLYKIVLRDQYGNPIKNKKINLLKHDCSWLWDSCYGIKTDQINSNWTDALNIFDFSNWWITNEKWEVELKIKSIAPWKYTNSFLLVLKEWDEEYVNTNNDLNIYAFNNQNNEFKNPIKIEKILISDNEWMDWEWKPEIWKEQKYKIVLDNEGLLNWYSNWFLDLSKNNIDLNVKWHFWKEFKNINKSFWNDINNPVWFEGLIDANDSVLIWPEIENKNLEISYDINNKNIKYYLNSEKIQWCSIETLWLKVEWNIQWDWKSEITGQEENISDISMSEARVDIRKNAFEITSWYTDWKMLNGVKYVEWDYIMESDPIYETIIVKNGNLIINSDVNTSNKKLWIIVLKDNYDVNTDYNKSWNIYISNNVNYIAASIFADWALRSAKPNWEKYTDSELNEKLELFWTLFTRNTIWGSVLGWENYTLPWWKTTNDYELAKIYDLNYVRQLPSCNVDYSFLIKYNPEIQLNPPKWFFN